MILEEATSDQLIEELRKRFPSIVLAYTIPPVGSEKMTHGWAIHGDLFATQGLNRYLSSRIEDRLIMTIEMEDQEDEYKN